MADQAEKKSIMDDALLAQMIVRNADGTISIDSSSLNKQTPETISVQQALSDEGLYVSKTHAYYNDGIAGDVTNFGLLMKADPAQNQNHIESALKDDKLSPDEIIKLQIALNASTDNPEEKITVDGIIGPQTTGRLADYLAENKIQVEPGGALGKALQKHAPTKLKALTAEFNDKCADKPQKQPTAKAQNEKPTANGDAKAPTNQFNGATSGVQPVAKEPAVQAPQQQGTTNTGTSSTNALFLQKPIDNGYRLSSPFGPRPSRGGHHEGVDFATPVGTPLKAPADAEVAYAGSSGGYGQVVILYHGNNVYTAHAHVPRSATNKLEIGDRFAQGEQFGVTGNTGRGTGAHLHTEVIIGDNKTGIVIDPEKAWQAGVNLADRDVQNRLIHESGNVMSNINFDNDSKVFRRRVASNYDPSNFDRHLASLKPDDPNTQIASLPPSLTQG